LSFTALRLEHVEDFLLEAKTRAIPAELFSVPNPYTVIFHQILSVMDIRVLERQFERIGAKLEVHLNERLRAGVDFSLDVREVKRDETFILTVARPALEQERLRLQVVDLQPALRHLLLHADVREGSAAGKQKLLCGHDERHWFVAGAREANAVNVRQAMESLKPAGVVASQLRKGVRAKDWHRRHNEGFIRQGEWFFVPRPDIGDKAVKSLLVLRNEPLRRGGGKPHWVDYLVRFGGETVYVSRFFPNGLLQEEYEKHLKEHPESRREHWNIMRRNPDVLIKGRIRHPDHATITLPFWHQVLMSTESAARNPFVAFLD
jgi:hypothetical protein